MICDQQPPGKGRCNEAPQLCRGSYTQHPFNCCSKGQRAIACTKIWRASPCPLLCLFRGLGATDHADRFWCRYDRGGVHTEPASRNSPPTCAVLDQAVLGFARPLAALRPAFCAQAGVWWAVALSHWGPSCCSDCRRQREGTPFACLVSGQVARRRDLKVADVGVTRSPRAEPCREH